VLDSGGMLPDLLPLDSETVRFPEGNAECSSPALPIRLFGHLKSEDRPPLSRKSCGGFAFLGVDHGQVRACEGAGQDQMGGLG